MRLFARRVLLVLLIPAAPFIWIGSSLWSQRHEIRSFYRNVPAVWRGD